MRWFNPARGRRTDVHVRSDSGSLAGRKCELRIRERSLQTVGRLSETSKRGRRSTRWKAPGQNGQVEYRASPSVEVFSAKFVRMAKIIR